jgi:disulfide bond formation protein DsbB
MQEQHSGILAVKPLKWPSRRLVNSLGFIICVSALTFAYAFLQFYRALEPCPLCVFQRLAMFATGLIFLLAALHNPGIIGARISAVWVVLAAGTGAAVAARHVWIQHLPPGQLPACGPDLDYMLRAFPLSETVRRVLAGSGDCAKIEWSFLTLSIPEWTLVIFVALGLIGVFYNWFSWSKTP